MNINPGYEVGAWTDVARCGTCEKLIVLQVLPVDATIKARAAKFWMLYTCWLPSQASIMELRRNKMLDFTSAHCHHKRQSWSCPKLDALQVLAVAPSINHGAANIWMIYKCWLTQHATGWFTSRRSRSKSTSRSEGRSREKLDAIPLLTVATRCFTSVHCRHKHESWIC
jgi:hypothetical protein